MVKGERISLSHHQSKTLVRANKQKKESPLYLIEYQTKEKVHNKMKGKALVYDHSWLPSCKKLDARPTPITLQ